MNEGPVMVCEKKPPHIGSGAERIQLLCPGCQSEKEYAKLLFEKVWGRR